MRMNNSDVFLSDSIQQYEMTDKWVADGIGDVYQYWHHSAAVMISAQTGSGKNSFILEQLLPYSIKTDQQIFLFSNRIALNVQQKRLLMRKLGIPDGIYTNYKIKEMSRFNNITVLSYHEALNYLSGFGYQYPIGGCPTANRPGCGFAVFDEAHFFLADSMFNAYTQAILKRLIFAFSYYTRIYMTATPENILPIVAQYEYANQERHKVTHYDIAGKVSNTYHESVIVQPDKQVLSDAARDIRYNKTAALNVYNFQRKYADYNIVFFTQQEQIFNIMVDGYNDEPDLMIDKDSKWLYFMNSKSNQQKAKNVLPANETDYYDSSKKQDIKIGDSLIEGKIPHRILITTSALDNGINITDSDLHNIVIDFEDKISLIQMLGRKRKTVDEKVNVFIQVPTYDLVSKRYKNIEDTLNLTQDFFNSPENFLQKHWLGFHRRYRNLFFFDNQQQIHLNELAITELQIRGNFYSNLLLKMQEAEEKGIATNMLEIYPQMVLQWLGLPQKIHWLAQEQIETAAQQMVDLLDSHIETGITENNKKTFCSDFQNLASLIDQKPFNADWRSGPSVMSKFLQAHSKLLVASYTIEGRGNWRIIKKQL